MSLKDQAKIINDNFSYLKTAKQDNISDLETIREGAGKGATAIQPDDNVSELTNDAKYQNDTEVAASISTHNTSTTAHSDIRTLISDEVTRATGVEGGLQTSVDTINGKIPSQATTTNQLADKSFVNSSIATETANFVGTFNSLEELEAVENPTNNDYGFVKTTDSSGNTVYNRYKYVASTSTWKFEYALNNSSFTAAQWAAINSGATTDLIGKISTNETAISNEVTRATTAEGNLSTSISDEATRATTAEGNLSTSISAEETRAKGVEESLANSKQDKTTAVTHTASTAVGSETKPVYVKADGTTAEITSYEGTAAKATADASGNVITSTYATKTEVSAKQDKLTAGNNIQIANNTISATDTTYTAGDGIKIEGTTISNTRTSAEWGKITGTLADQTDLQTALNAKQDTISDLATIRAGATAGSTAVQPGDSVSTLTNDAGYIDKNVGDLTKYTTTTNLMIELARKEDVISDLATIRAGATAGSTAIQPNDNISELTNDAGYITNAYHDSTKQDVLTAGANIQITNNTISATDTTYTAGTGIKIEGNTISSTQTSAEWGKITGTLSSQTDLQNALNAKQATISDLATIRSNATAGKSASDTIATYGNIVTHNATEFATAAQGTLADSAIQPNDNVSELTNNAKYQTDTEVASAISTHNTATDAHEDIREKIKDIELFKFPNAIIIGSPLINNGQVSNFTTANYMQFPFVVDVRNKNFEIDFVFTTGSDVTTQQNILDSKFGLALAIQNGKGVMALSSNGTAWDIGVITGSMDIATNTTYYAKMTWDGATYKTALSTDGETYTDDMSVASTSGLYPTTMFIGGCSGSVIGHTAYPFSGIINMNKCYLYIAGLLVWQGMDDAGLATRADVSLSNLDSVGEARFSAKQDVLTASDGITITNNNITNDLVTDTDDVFITLDDVDPSSPEYDPDNLYPGKEDVANKVTVVDSTSSDVTYPTSLAVYSALNEKDATAVHKTGDETIAGTKTFSSTIAGNISGIAAKATADGSGNNIVSTYQPKTTAVTHTASTAAGSATVPVYVNASGVATAITSYTGNVTGNVTGNCSGSSGSCTGNSATATKATQDSAGQQINTTYIKGLSASGTTVTYTKGDGTTGTITTQDTNNKVQSTVSSTNTNYPILLNNGTAATTNTALIDTGIYANPSTNTIGADKVGVANKVTMQYNSTTEAIEFVFA